MKTDKNLEVYLSEIKRFPLLSSREERELSREIKRGNKYALEELIKCNLRLSLRIAYRYNPTNLPLLDLIQIANLGLIKAAEKYDYKKGRFSTIASYYIEGYIKNAFRDTSSQIKIPQWLKKHIKKARGVIKQQGHFLADKEVAEQCGIGYKHLKLVFSALTVKSPRSLEENLSSNREQFTLSRIINNGILNYSEIDTKLDIRILLEELTKEEAYIINKKYGLGGYKEESAEKIGRAINLSRFRIIQIEKKALEKLRRAALRKGLMERV